MFYSIFSTVLVLLPSKKPCLFSENSFKVVTNICNSKGILPLKISTFLCGKKEEGKVCVIIFHPKKIFLLSLSWSDKGRPFVSLC